MATNDRTGKQPQPATTAGAAKGPSKDPRAGHPLNKAELQRPGGHGFNPGGFSPKPMRVKHIGGRKS